MIDVNTFSGTFLADFENRTFEARYGQILPS